MFELLRESFIQINNIGILWPNKTGSAKLSSPFKPKRLKSLLFSSVLIDATYSFDLVYMSNSILKILKILNCCI